MYPTLTRYAGPRNAKRRFNGLRWATETEPWTSSRDRRSAPASSTIAISVPSSWRRTVLGSLNPNPPPMQSEYPRNCNFLFRLTARSDFWIAIHDFGCPKLFRFIPARALRVDEETRMRCRDVSAWGPARHLGA